MATVVLQNVEKSYSKAVAVRNLSLSVADGEFVVLVGPSGCGKSTTLRVVAGLEEVSAGEVYIGDHLVNGVAPADRDIAMVFQNYALYPHMDAYENMAFALKVRRLARDEVDRRVRWAADVLGLGELLRRKPRELSGGQRQRVALGRAIVRRPQVFLMDEPLSNLDAELRVQMRAEIARLHQRLQTTTLYVTHDQVEAMTMGDRIVVMKDGLVQQVGPPQELYDRPANRFVAGFIGTVAMNFVPGVLRPDGAGLVFDAGAFTCPLPPALQPAAQVRGPGPVTLGIRAEHILAGAHPSDDPDAAGKGPPAAIDCTVEVVEPLGSEVHLHLAAGPHRLVARVMPELRARPGDGCTVALQVDRIHLFNAETQAAMR